MYVAAVSRVIYCVHVHEKTVKHNSLQTALGLDVNQAPKLHVHCIYDHVHVCVLYVPNMYV